MGCRILSLDFRLSTFNFLVYRLRDGRGMVRGAGVLKHPVEVIEGKAAGAHGVSLADGLGHISFGEHDCVAELPP